MIFKIFASMIIAANLLGLIYFFSETKIKRIGFRQLFDDMFNFKANPLTQLFFLFAIASDFLLVFAGFTYVIFKLIYIS